MPKEFIKVEHLSAEEYERTRHQMTPSERLKLLEDYREYLFFDINLTSSGNFFNYGNVIPAANIDERFLTDEQVLKILADRKKAKLETREPRRIT